MDKRETCHARQDNMCTGGGVVTFSQGSVCMLAWGGEIREIMCLYSSASGLLLIQKMF